MKSLKNKEKEYKVIKFNDDYHSVVTSVVYDFEQAKKLFESDIWHFQAENKEIDRVGNVAYC